MLVNFLLTGWRLCLSVSFASLRTHFSMRLGLASFGNQGRGSKSMQQGEDKSAGYDYELKTRSKLKASERASRNKSHKRYLAWLGYQFRIWDFVFDLAWSNLGEASGRERKGISARMQRGCRDDNESQLAHSPGCVRLHSFFPFAAVEE